MKKKNLSYHEVAEEFHYEKNHPFIPDSFTLGSNKKIWWKCKVDPEHEWEAIVKNRTAKNSGCPFCSGRNPTAENNLSLHKISEELDLKKNKPFTPKDFTLKSNKKIWWKCKVNPEHEWETTVVDRVNKGIGCPFCSGQRPSKENNLSLHEVSKEFHYEKNSPLTPEDFTLRSGKKVWWKCSVNPEHKWRSAPNQRTNGNGCPFCSGQRPSKENNLSLHEVSKEFHCEKNYPSTPEDFTLGSKKKVWWKCSVNPEHEWEAVVKNRVNGNGCPMCSSNGTSKSEQELLEWIKSLGYEVDHRLKLNGLEADIYVPEKSLVIEFNGLYWHSSLFKGKTYHLEKLNFFKKKGLNLVYIWEDEWVFHKTLARKSLKSLLEGKSEIKYSQNKRFWVKGNKRMEKFKKGCLEIWAPETLIM